MSRGITVVVGLVVVSGCSKLLGFQAPQGVNDATGGDGAPAGDFTIQSVHTSARVPAGSFDFVELSVTRGAGNAAPIDISVPHPPAGVMGSAATIDAASTTGQIEITGDASLTIGSAFMLDIVGTDGTNTHDVMVMLPVTGVPGTLDVTFGSDHTGVVDIDLGTNVGFFSSIAVDGSDDVFVAGVNNGELGDTPTLGILGSAGNVVTTSTFNKCGCTNADEFQSVVINSSGRIFAAGESNNKGSSAPDEPVVVAFTGSGALDPGFANASGDEFFILGEGIQINSQATDGTNLLLETDTNALIRIPDTGQGGILQGGWNDADGALPVLITATGPQAVAADVSQHVYVVGQGSAAFGSNDAVIERITEAGVIDAAFGSNGVIDSGVAGSFSAALVLADHSVLAAGATAGGNFVLFRVLSTGAPDSTFGTAGIAQPALPSLPSGALTVTGMVVQTDGKIVVSGNNASAAVLARYLPDGTLDPTFGSGGAASIPAGLMPNIAGVQLQSTGMIVITGGNADLTLGLGHADGNGYIARFWF